MIFPTYELDCKNGSNGHGPHRIDLPLPAQLTLGGAPPSREHIKDVLFACPVCRHIHRYDGGDLRHRVSNIELDRLPPTPVSVRIRLLCDHPGCGATLTIYTTRQTSESKEAVRQRLRGGTFHIRCHNGHQPGFGDDQPCEISDGPLCNPF